MAWLLGLTNEDSQLALAADRQWRVSQGFAYPSKRESTAASSRVQVNEEALGRLTDYVSFLEEWWDYILNWSTDRLLLSPILAHMLSSSWRCLHAAFRALYDFIVFPWHEIVLIVFSPIFHAMTHGIPLEKYVLFVSFFTEYLER